MNSAVNVEVRDMEANLWIPDNFSQSFRLVDANGGYPAYMSEQIRDELLERLGDQPVDPDSARNWCKIRCDLNRVVTEYSHMYVAEDGATRSLWELRGEWSLQAAWEAAIDAKRNDKKNPFDFLVNPPENPKNRTPEPIKDCICGRNNPDLNVEKQTKEDRWKRRDEPTGRLTLAGDKVYD